MKKVDYRGLIYISIAGLFISPTVFANSSSLEDRIERLENQSVIKAKSHGGWFNFRGRLHIDAAAFNGDEGGHDFNDGTQLRRARLGLEGGFYDDWRWRLEADFAGGNSVALQDAYLQYRGFNNTILTVGQQLAPTSMSTLSGSAQALPLMERGSVVNAFDRFRTIGVSAWHSSSKHWYLQTAYHGEGAQTGGAGTGAAGGNQESHNFHGRVGIAPINETNKVAHIAVSGHHQTSIQNEVQRFRDRPEIRVDNFRVVDTGNINNVSSANQFIVDGFGSYENFYVQGEYWNRSLSRNAGNEDVSFDGYYVQGGYIITGEHKPYTSFGRYGRIKPKKNFTLDGGTGAWEIVFRYSELDLNDGPITGGEMSNTTVGLNWYFNQQASLMFNWVRFDAKNTPQATIGNRLDGDILAARFSFDW